MEGFNTSEVGTIFQAGFDSGLNGEDISENPYGSEGVDAIRNGLWLNGHDEGIYFYNEYLAEEEEE